jgi:hypothetical protein
MCFFLNKKKIQSHTSDLFMESISDRVNQIFRLVDSIISLGGKMLASTSMDHHRSVRLVAELKRRRQPVRSAYQPPASSTFLSEQTSHQQSASSTLLSEQTSTSDDDSLFARLISHQYFSLRTNQPPATS